MSQPTLGRRAAAEAIGTFALVFAGCGAVVTDAQRDGALGVVGIGLVFFFVLLAAIAALGHVSGAHFNPGVSFSFFLTRHLPGRDLGVYVAAQLVGPALAAGQWQDFWVYLVGPFVGAPLGALAYQFVRGEHPRSPGRHHVPQEAQDADGDRAVRLPA
jgi:glycerol uptake facilitator-like aquaporin